MLRIEKARAQDEQFLFELYAETRREEVEQFGWSDMQVQRFLRMQFDMQQRSYKQQYPDAESGVVMCEGTRIGKLYTAHLPHSIVLVDIALLTEYRNRGFGTSLIRDLQIKAASAGKSVRLQVIESNSARQLYERLGFIFAGGTFPYVSMEWNCEQTKGDD